MKNRLLTAIFVTLAGVAIPAGAYAQSTPPPPPQTAPPPPDNTKNNKQGGPTADDQSQTKADLTITQKIRQAIIKDKTLSMDAHNCKIITKNGAVTLRGPVDSTTEKTTVAGIALKVAGEGKVTNELTIKPKTSKL